MRRKLWVWLVIMLSSAPLFSNCHQATSLGFATGESENSEPTPPTESDDSSIAHAFQEGSDRAKVELDPSSLVNGTGNGSSTGLQGKTSTAETIVPQGLRLFVLIDNDCLAEHLQEGSTSPTKSEDLPLSARVWRSSSGRIEGLKLQAYSVENSSDLALSQLQEEVDADACIQRIANDEPIQLLDPQSPPALREIEANENISSLNNTGSESQKSVAIQSSTNDPALASQLHLQAISATSGWNVFFSPSRGITQDVTVAIIDSGIDYSHPDLAANIWHSADGNAGKDFVNNDNDPMDDHGHGTHVAGLLGAVSSNGVGVSGVMGQNIHLMAVKVVGSTGSGAPSALANGVRFAADNGAEVINMSLGYPNFQTEIRDAVIYAVSKGAVVITAAGNSSGALGSGTLLAPALYAATTPGLLAVGSFDSVSKQKSLFSNYSSTLVRISAPGSTGILSTYPDGKYAVMEGTSMATPIVSGAAALIRGLAKSEGITLSAAQVVELLVSSSRTNSALNTYFANGAMLDLDRLGKIMKSRYLTEGDGGTQ